MAAPATTIEQVTEVSDEVQEAVARLLPQLSTSAVNDRTTLSKVLGSPASTLLVARLDGAILGMCTLATFVIPTGVRAWIEDVVVDDAVRGGGLGTALVEEAVRLAKLAGARSVDLTSRPERVAANRLYLRCGFVLRETNVYRFSLESEA